MSYSIVGSCPHCGSPIYSPAVWGGTTPPPAQRSCNCVPPQWGWSSTTITVDGEGNVTGGPFQEEKREDRFTDPFDIPIEEELTTLFDKLSKKFKEWQEEVFGIIEPTETDYCGCEGNCSPFNDTFDGPCQSDDDYEEWIEGYRAWKNKILEKESPRKSIIDRIMDSGLRWEIDPEHGCEELAILEEDFFQLRSALDNLVDSLETQPGEYADAESAQAAGDLVREDLDWAKTLLREIKEKYE